MWLLVVLAVLLLPKVVQSTYVLYLLSMLLLYTVFGLGANLFFGHCGQHSFGHQGFYAIGAYTVALLAKHFELPFIVSLIAGGLVATLVALVVGFPLLLRLRGTYLALGTFAFGMIIFYVAEQWVSLTGGFNGIIVPIPTVLGHPLNREQLYYITAFFALASFLICYLLIRSRVGRAFKSIRDNEVAAGSCGINIFNYRLMAFGLSAFLCGLAGGLYSYTSGWICSGDFGVELVLVYFVIVLVGGLGSNTGQLLGAAFVVFVPELLFGMELRVFVNGVVLALVVIFLPQGLTGGLSRVISWIARKLVTRAPEISMGSVPEE